MDADFKQFVDTAKYQKLTRAYAFSHTLSNVHFYALCLLDDFFKDQAKLSRAEQLFIEEFINTLFSEQPLHFKVMQIYNLSEAHPFKNSMPYMLPLCFYARHLFDLPQELSENIKSFQHVLEADQKNIKKVSFQVYAAIRDLAVLHKEFERLEKVGLNVFSRQSIWKLTHSAAECEAAFNRKIKSYHPYPATKQFDLLTFFNEMSRYVFFEKKTVPHSPKP